ncbi:peptide chain release factor N(5)-glutamine methyltransferase [Patescibacteria group bacterium]|nr:peptide chain release factor N(5)-glutamine methyltransferase [Patescibacteria group bacterium]
MPGKPQPTIQSLLRQAAPKLRPKKITCAEDRDLGRLEAELLLGHVLGMDRVALIAHADRRIGSATIRRFDALIRRRLRHEPISQITGTKGFYGRDFSVTKNVLTPRPETELLIELALSLCHPRAGGDPASRSRNPDSRLHGNDTGVVFWDVGTGSGAIAVTLACETSESPILATDLSLRAIEMAKHNAKKHGVTKRIRFEKSDLLQPVAYRWLKKQAAENNTLIICANLPYLPDSDKKELEPDVVKFEPSSALFAGTDGLRLIRKLLGQLARHLPEWGYKKTTMLFEFDPPQSQVLLSLAQSLFPNASSVEILRDLAERDRILKISLTAPAGPTSVKSPRGSGGALSARR